MIQEELVSLSVRGSSAAARLSLRSLLVGARRRLGGPRIAPPLELGSPRGAAFGSRSLLARSRRGLGESRIAPPLELGSLCGAAFGSRGAMVVSRRGLRGWFIDRGSLGRRRCFVRSARAAGENAQQEQGGESIAFSPPRSIGSTQPATLR